MIGKETFRLYLGGADGGTFTLGDGVGNTSAIAFDATAATIQTELNTLYGAGTSTVEVDTDFTIKINIGAITNLEANLTNLSNATDPALTLLSTEKICIVDTASTAWAASTEYDTVGTVVVNDSGKRYRLVTAGTSASSGGPTGTGTGISDGTCVWDYYLVHYSSLNAAIVGESGATPVVVTDADLADNDEQLTISCRASRRPDGTHAADTTAVSVTGFTTDADNYIKVIAGADHRHAGAGSDTKYRLVGSTSSYDPFIV